MNEENNASGRLDSASYYKSGDEIMCSMSEEAGDIEPDASNSSDEDQGILHNYSTAIAALAATYFAVIVVVIIVSRMWDEDEIRLHILNALMRVLQTIARISGGWALACEKAYNDYANTLH